jgi:hypothetical protein
MTIVIDTDRPRLRAGKPSEFPNDAIKPGDNFAMADEPGNQSFGIWHFDGENVFRIDLGEAAVPPRIRIPIGADVASTLRSTPGIMGKYFTVQRMVLIPGTFYPGIARPETRQHGAATFQAPDFMWRRSELTASLLQLRSLFQSLEEIFQIVHPAPANLQTFGSSIRDLIILACTECEAQWLSVLRLNKYPCDRPTRKDYKKLGKAMRLYDYTVQLRHYRDLEPLAPFHGWNGSRHDSPLPWYDDYNAVKHDRAGSFKRATLATALEAVAACWVMIAAQYGYRALREFSDLNDRFQIKLMPRWTLAECYYAGALFSPADEVPYPF